MENVLKNTNFYIVACSIKTGHKMIRYVSCLTGHRLLKWISLVCIVSCPVRPDTGGLSCNRHPGSVLRHSLIPSPKTLYNIASFLQTKLLISFLSRYLTFPHSCVCLPHSCMYFPNSYLFLNIASFLHISSSFLSISQHSLIPTYVLLIPISFSK